MTRLALIREAHQRYLARRPPRFAVVGADRTTHHHGIEQATAANTRRQARVVVRLEDGELMTVVRGRALNVDRLMKRLERHAPELDPEELPDAEAEGEEAAE